MLIKLILLILVYNHFYHADVANGDKLVVNTTAGLVRGLLLTFEDVDYLSFKGIPFAEPPIGNLRFKPPLPKVPWQGILDAYDYGNSCMQSERDYLVTSEDCLLLNVFVPAKSSYKDPLPVLFYIHGGLLKSGNAKIYGPQYLMKKDVVVVTPDYRVGSFGFLSLDIPAATGNNGLKDIVLALEWTHKNIAKFGGDPDKVTVGGLSAGSAIVNYLLLTEKTNGLFRAAILDSGAALGYRFNPNPVKNAKSLADELCDNVQNDKIAILECLLAQNASYVFEGQKRIESEYTRAGFAEFVPFLPVAEIDSDHRIIKENPRMTFKHGIKQNVPVLVGTICKEGYKMMKDIRNNPSYIELLNEDPIRFLPFDLYKLDYEDRHKTVDKIRKFYFDGGNITTENLESYFDMISDTQYLYPTFSWIKLHKNHEDSADIFYYDFCFDGQYNTGKYSDEVDQPGASHGDQLGYLFRDEYRFKLYYESIELDERTNKTLQRMTSMWSNFVKTGNPTPDGFEIVWEKTKHPNFNHLYISDNLVNVHHIPYEDRMLFWDNLYADYYFNYAD